MVALRHVAVAPRAGQEQRDRLVHRALDAVAPALALQDRVVGAR